MKFLAFLLLAGTAAQAQTASQLSFYLDTSGGLSAIQQLQSFPSTYSFASTPVGSVTSVGVRVVNLSASTVEIPSIGFVSGTQQNNNFSSNLGVDISLAPGQSQFFYIYFAPLATGATTASAQVSVGSTSLATFSTLQGTGSPTQIGLSCNNSAVTSCNGSTLQPSQAAAINFGNVSTTSSFAITFTLTNGGNTAINPQQLVSIITPTDNPSTAFALGTLPSSIAAGGSGTFTITFAPGNTNTQQTTLSVAGNTFTLQGTGVASVTGDISSLVITYTNSAGVTLAAQAASAINFGSSVTGTGIAPSLLFTVSNPATTIGPVSVPTISVSGAGFAISGTNPAPASIQPGSSITFSITFAVGATGTYTGTLLIGSRSFSLTGQSIVSSLPAASISVDQQLLLSQQQPHVTVNLASAAPTAEIGTLTMTFTPSVANIADDPAIEFVATSSRQLQVTAASGATTASYNGQSAITFQTGTTAGTITFTVQFPSQPAVTQSYTIAPAAVQITSGTAVAQSPNLVVTLNGYDNTYSTGQLSFVFYGTTGQVLTPTAISVNASTNFHQYFFGTTQSGGAFSVQATFPVSGDVTQVGSVAVTLSNSVGQAASTQTFP